MEIVQTKGIADYIEQDPTHRRAMFVMACITDHLAGKDYGVCTDDAKANQYGRENEGRVLNSFSFEHEPKKFWVLTEAWGHPEGYTTVLFPEEY